MRFVTIIVSTLSLLATTVSAATIPPIVIPISNKPLPPLPPRIPDPAPEVSWTPLDRITYDEGYDDPFRSLEHLSCSDGENGLMTKFGYKKQTDIPRFPYIAGMDRVEGWNSTNCGTCWAIEFGGRTIFVLAVDHLEHGINLPKKAMDDLTWGRSVELGSVVAEVYQVPQKNCDLPL